MRIAYENKFDSAIITSSGENIEYPLINLKDQRLCMPFEYSASSVSIYVDLGAVKPVGTLAVLGHNLSSAATVIFTAYVTSDYLLPPDFTQSCTWNEGMILSFVSSQNYQYWKIDIEDAWASKISIGRIWMGEYITISPSSLLDFKITKKRSDRNIYGINRQKWGLEGVGWRKFELSFPDSASDMIELIRAMFVSVGKHTSFIFCNFDTIRDYKIVEPCYVSIANDLVLNHSSRMRFKYNLVMEEER